MKKLKLICVLLGFVFLCACTEKSLPKSYEAKQILDIAINATQEYENTVEYIKGTKDLDSFNMSLWADGAYAECAEFELLDDYALCYSGDNGTYEISVLKAKNADDIEMLAKVLERRKTTLSSGDRAAYDPNFDRLIKDAQIITSGNFAILLVTDDNAAAQEKIDTLKQ